MAGGSGDGAAEAARIWRDVDPDPGTRAELTALIDDPARGDELAALFAGRLQFGTAGLRGALGPGPLRMNRVLVALAAAGLGRYLTDQGLQGRGPVVVGWDARHHSDVFARDTAELLAGAGFEVLLFDRHLPTPLVPFTIRARGAIAGIVVTASHNPPADNGYKVYLGDGSQIVPPADADIAAAIDTVAVASVPDLPRSDAYTRVGNELVDAYVERAAATVPTGPRRVRWVHTALHGVGAPIMTEAAARAGFPAPVEVAEQRDPDPDFPTVAFPNPEEPGAIDRAVALAAEHDADVVIANDPDADRCAVAVRDGDRWRMLTGDEVGDLLGASVPIDHASDRAGVFAASVVSSTRLRAIAADRGVGFTATLTGFKWIGRAPGLVFGYEEAIGYCCDPTAVPDKDGVTAGLQILALVARTVAEGRSVADLLVDLDQRYGVVRTSQLSIRVEQLAEIATMMERLRATPPTTLLDETVEVTDLARPTADLPATDGVVLEGTSVRVVVRPSGTEPKLKCYLQVATPPGDVDLDAARVTVIDRLAGLRRSMADVLGVNRR